MPKDDYIVVSWPPRLQFARGMRGILRLVRVRNTRTGVTREMSIGQMLKRRRAGQVRIDERVFMQGRK